jgi:hypothetical protein
MYWDDPAPRLPVVERVGPNQDDWLIKQHHRDSTLAIVNGRAIWPIGSGCGRLFMVEGTRIGFNTLEKAEAFAATLL